MKTNYIAPAVESLKLETKLIMAGQSNLGGNNQEGDGEQLSKEQHDFFDVDSVLNKYVPNVFTDMSSEEEE